MTAPRPLAGLRLVTAYLDRSTQEALLAALRTVFAAAPLYTPYPAHAQERQPPLRAYDQLWGARLGH